MFHLPVLQAKMFWQIRATCRKPLITNESGLMLLFVHLKSMIYWRWHTIKGHRASCISPPSPSRNAVYLTMSEPMSLSIVHLIRYWTAAVNNIHNFCKLGFLFTFVSYKMRQVDYCTRVPSLFTHSHAHTHTRMQTLLWLMIALSRTVHSKRLCKSISLKQSMCLASYLDKTTALRWDYHWGPNRLNWEMSFCKKACSVIIIFSSDQEGATTITWPKS